MNTKFPTRVLLAAGLSMALQLPSAQADEVKQGLLTQSQRQESVGRSMNNSISELEALLADLESNGMVDQDAGNRVGSLEEVLSKINQEHVPAASSAMRDAALSVDARGQHLDKASSEVELILGQLKTVLKDLGDQQRAAAYESILTGLISDNSDLIEATKDWGEAQVLNPEQADDIKKDVSDLQKDVDNGIDALTEMIKDDLEKAPDSPLADKLEKVVKALTDEEPAPPKSPEPESTDAPEPPTPTAESPEAPDPAEMADAPEPGDAPEPPASTDDGGADEPPALAEDGTSPEMPDQEDGGADDEQPTDMAGGDEAPEPEGGDPSEQANAEDAMAGVEANNPEAALTSQIETGNKLMDALKALNPEALAGGMATSAPPPGTDSATAPPPGEMAGGDMPPNMGEGEPMDMSNLPGPGEMPPMAGADPGEMDPNQFGDSGDAPPLSDADIESLLNGPPPEPVDGGDAGEPPQMADGQGPPPEPMDGAGPGEPPPPGEGQGPPPEPMAGGAPGEAPPPMPGAPGEAPPPGAPGAPAPAPPGMAAAPAPPGLPGAPAPAAPGPPMPGPPGMASAPMVGPGTPSMSASFDKPDGSHQGEDGVPPGGGSVQGGLAMGAQRSETLSNTARRAISQDYERRLPSEYRGLTSEYFELLGSSDQ